MQLVRIAVVGLVTAAVLAASLNLELAAQEKKPPESQVSKGYRIFLKDVKVKTKTAKSEHWDAFEGKPDIRVYLKNHSEPKSKDFTSATKMDTFAVAYNVAAITVREGQIVEIQVIDVDVAFNDEIGKKRLKLTREMLDKGGLELTFGQVQSLRLEFQATPPAGPRERIKSAASSQPGQ